MPLEGRSSTNNSTAMKNKIKIPDPPPPISISVSARTRTSNVVVVWKIPTPFYDYKSIANCGFFAIYDGHGGKSAADWCGANLHRVLQENWDRDQGSFLNYLIAHLWSVMNSSIQRMEFIQGVQRLCQ